jgi:FkbM family methyltransferase
LKPFELLLVRMTQGKSVNSFVAKLVPSHYLYRSPSPRNIKRDGLSFCVDISDLVDWHLYFNFYEPSHEKLYGLCEENFTVFDVGTNNGALLLRLSKEVHKGYVYGFEPDPVNYHRCLNNIALNNPKNAQVFNVALGASSGEAYINIVDNRNLGMNKIVYNSDSGNKIDVTTLDEFVESNNVKKIDIIKIDTEGFEMNVLEGAINILRKFHPVLFIEVDDNNLIQQGSSAKKLVGFLENLGYSINRADTEKKIGEGEYINCHFDIIAKKN